MTKDRVSPYFDRSSLQEASASQYRTIGSALCDFFKPFQQSSYVNCVVFHDQIFEAEEQSLYVDFDDTLGVTVKSVSSEASKPPSDYGPIRVDHTLLSLDWINKLSQDLRSDALSAVGSGVIVFGETFEDRRVAYRRMGITSGLDSKIDPIFPAFISLVNNDVKLIFYFDDDSGDWFVVTGDSSERLSLVILLFNGAFFISRIEVTVSAKSQVISKDSIAAADRYLLIVLDE